MESPITALFKQACATSDKYKGFIDFMGFLNLSRERYHILESGGYYPLPKSVNDVANEIYGEGGERRLDTEYQAYRATLSPETLQALEKQLFPAGRCYGMCP